MHIGIIFVYIGVVIMIAGIALLIYGAYEKYGNGKATDEQKASATKFLIWGAVVGGIGIIMLIGGMIAKRTGH